MESFLSRYRNPLVLLAVVLAQMLGLAVQVRRPTNGQDGHQTRLIRYWVVSLISPFERVFLFAGHGVSNAWNGYFDLRHVRAQNQQLQAELNRMRLEEASLAEDARQDMRLQKLFAFQQQYVSKTIAAHVIGTSGTDLSRVLYIDQGTANGIRTDMPVITPDGVVGKVRDVFPHTAQVLEINDPTSGLGVILTQTRLRGILRGNTAGRTEIVDILPDERIQSGEQVVTSGGDQIYPRGLPVGIVERVVNDPERNPYVAILIRPAVNLSRLDEVLVITKITDVMPADMQQDVTTSEQKAADILSQRLPAAAPAPLGPDGKPMDTNAPPPASRPPTALHPDRFTPGATPDANGRTPDTQYQKQVSPSQRQPASPSATRAPSAAKSPDSQQPNANKEPQN
jgi:rod shape-determining protein MreC